MFKQQTRPIIGELEKITSRGYNSYDVFEDWLDLMLYALMRNDEKYLKIVAHYRNDDEMGRREIDLFKNAFHLLLDGMAQVNEELLGEIYMEWSISKKRTGQFFTPCNVAKVMAEITAPYEGDKISDPACGSGVLLIQTAKLLTAEHCDTATFYARDLDLTCVKMCALNMCFFNLNAQIECGNSLTMEHPRAVYRTVRSYLGGSIVEINPAEIKMSKPETHQSNAFEHFKQASLFN